MISFSSEAFILLLFLTVFGSLCWHLYNYRFGHSWPRPGKFWTAVNSAAGILLGIGVLIWIGSAVAAWLR